MTTLATPAHQPVHRLRLAGTALAAALCGAVLALGGLGGCGGGVGTEGTGSYASGTIVGYGSIIVNGVHFDVGLASVQDEDGRPINASTLALGMVVQINGGPVTTTHIGTVNPVATPGAVATLVRANRALVGPAAALSATAGRFSVLGQTVLVTVDTVFDPRLVGGLAGVTQGQQVEVYGFYDDSSQAYVATRIAPATAGAAWRVGGTVVSVDSAQTYTLGTQSYLVASTSGLSAGSVINVQLQSTSPDSKGRWLVSGQRAGENAPQDSNDVEIDGLVAGVMSASRFVVGGVTVDTTSASVTGTVEPGAKVEVGGSLRGGVLLASTVQASALDVVKIFELSGKITSLDTANHRFVLRDTTVSYGAGTVFKNGNAAKLVGYSGRVKIEGGLSADGTLLLATSIAFDD